MTTKTKPKPSAKKRSTSKSPKAPAAAGPDYPELPIASIDPHPANPRTDFDPVELQRLTASIKTHGLLQPVVVRELASGRYQVIAGGRRLAAAKAAGRKTIPATIRNVSDDEALSLALVENVVRCDLNPVDMARAVAQLCAPTTAGGCAMSHVEAAAKLSRDASWIARQIRLLTLPECWLKRVASGEISVTMSKHLVPYANRPNVLARIEEDMIAHPWSWRTSDDFGRNAKLLAEDQASTTTPAPTELRPMRAAPGSGERQRESRSAGEPTTPPATTAEANGSSGSAPTLAELVTPRSERNDAVERRTDPDLVGEILTAIADLTDLADLARVATAVEARRADLKRAARQSR